MRNRGIRVVSGLLVCAVLLLILLLSLDASPPAQAQEPDVSASAITQNISASVSVITSTSVSGSTTLTFKANAKPSITVRATCWGPFKIRVSSNLSGNVPLTVIYLGGRTESKNMAMSGSATQVFTPSICIYNTPYPYGVTLNVPVTGSVQVTPRVTETSVTVLGSGTLYGAATAEVEGSARLITYAYLPLIARQDVPAGGAWSDDFSSDKGWRAIIPDNCDVGVDNETLRVKLKKTAQVPEDICWITAPVNNGPLLAQGTFQVGAVRTTDKKASYALIFNATTSLLEHHWQLGASPWDGSESCGSGRAGIWLSYVDKGVGPGDRWPTCTSVLKRGKNEWNTLKVVRRSDSVEGYINGEKKIEADDEDAPYLKDAGLFDLAVWGEDGAEIRFDNFSVTP